MNFLTKIGLEDKLVLELPIEKALFLKQLRVKLTTENDGRVKIPDLYEGTIKEEHFFVYRKNEQDSDENHYTLCEGRLGENDGKTILLCNIKPLTHQAIKNLLIQWFLGFLSLFGIASAATAFNLFSPFGLFCFTAFLLIAVFFNWVQLSKQAKKMKKEMQTYFTELANNIPN